MMKMEVGINKAFPIKQTEKGRSHELMQRKDECDWVDGQSLGTLAWALTWLGFGNYIIYMTLNCPVNQVGQPLALPQEQFILYRPNIEFELTIDGLGKKKAKGTGYLTSFRIIFVAQKPEQQFYSFDIPIGNLFAQKVEMPIFGSNYLQGSCTPYQNLLPGNSHFKLYFKEGNCDTFIRILSRLIKQVRSSMNMHQNFQQSQFYQDMRKGQFNFNAYVNPNDPSKLYTQQPQH